MTVAVKYKISWDTGYITYSSLQLVLRFVEMMLDNGTPVKVEVNPDTQ